MEWGREELAGWLRHHLLGCSAIFVGHDGAAFAAKRVDPSIPLWALFIAVQLLDVLWAPCILLGIEKVRIVPGMTASNPLELYYMPYTHSLPGALFWSAGALLAYRWLARPRFSQKAAFVVALAVFSHWGFDLVVHRPDLPLYDNTAKVGFGRRCVRARGRALVWWYVAVLEHRLRATSAGGGLGARHAGDSSRCLLRAAPYFGQSRGVDRARGVRGVGGNHRSPRAGAPPRTSRSRLRKGPPRIWHNDGSVSHPSRNG